jgi:hypothetical protein
MAWGCLVALGSAATACYWITPYQDLTAGVGKDSGADVGEGAAGPPPVEAGGGDAGADAQLPAIPGDGLVMWLRADDGLVTGPGGRVSTWSDESPRLNPSTPAMNATQADASAQPLRVADDGGVVAVSFSGGQVLGLPPGFADFTRGITIFMAAKPTLDVTGGAGTVFATGLAGECARAAELGYDQFGIDYRVENFPIGESKTVTGTTWNVVGVVQPAGTACVMAAVTIQVDGVLVSGSSDTAPVLADGVRPNSFVGRSTYFNDSAYQGLVGEILVYDRALGSTDLTAVTSYLHTKWVAK